MSDGTRRSTFWCEQAWLGGDRATDGVTITIEGDRITAVEPGTAAPPPPSVVRLDGLTFPGFANAHSHAFHRALRGRTHRGDGTFWTWRDRMYEVAAALDPDLYEDLATATFAEMVQSGYTCVGEFHYVHRDRGGGPYANRNEMGQRIVSAARAAGIRMTLLDTCYLAGGIGTALDERQVRFGDGSVDAWSDRVDEMTVPAGDRIRLGAAIHSVRAVAPDAMRQVAGWAADRDSVLHAHVSEQPGENAECLAAYGCTPVELLARSGALGERFTAVHATHVTADDIRALALTRSRCCICATTERELADGIGPTAALRHEGVALCVGSDSHAVIDPFEETRAIELDERLASLNRGTHQPAALMEAATAAGYTSLGWPNGGTIHVGALADLVTVSFDSVRLAGADRVGDPLGAAVFSATTADVRHVVVAGQPVVRDGRHQGVNVTRALESSIGEVWNRVGRR